MTSLAKSVLTAYHSYRQSSAENVHQLNLWYQG